MAGDPLIKIYTDENVNVRLAQALRQRGYDAQTTQEADNCGATDEEQLEFVVREEAVLLTHNIKHFEKLHREYLQENKTHCGILLCDQQPVQSDLPKFLQYMTNFLERSTKEQMISQLRHLEEFK